MIVDVNRRKASDRKGDFSSVGILDSSKFNGFPSIPMICPKCRISHDNHKGYCPNCRSVAHFVKQQKEGAFTSGDFCVEVCEVCEKCGREVFGKRICLSDSNARLLGFAEWFSPDEHDCSQSKDHHLT